MKLCFGLLLALLAGCNKLVPLKGIKDIRPGETSLHEALKILEDPIRVTSPIGSDQRQIYHWEEFQLQIDNRHIQAVFREPLEIEKSFLYWRHAYRGVQSNMTKLANQELWQLTVPSEGLAVIYDSQNDVVTKVILYEAPL